MILVYFLSQPLHLHIRCALHRRQKAIFDTVAQ